jgi:hypothetical protein
VEHQKAARPQDYQQQRDFEERFEVHFLPPSGVARKYVSFITRGRATEYRQNAVSP